MLILIFVQFVSAILVFIVQDNIVSLHNFEDYVYTYYVLPYVHAYVVFTCNKYIYIIMCSYMWWVCYKLLMLKFCTVCIFCFSLAFYTI